MVEMDADEVKTLLKEVIIENFMSYEYSRIEISPGLNIITGPNGAGKSSILLAISIAMGQSHTERAKKLAGLIRRGKDYGIVSIVLDNASINGKRPFPTIRQDDVMISRILRKDGQYSFQINYSPATKMEVNRLLRRAGINPDNMLIIMHQNMIEFFGFVDPKEKLKLFEEALGLSEYRERIIDSKMRLEKISGEEAEIKTYFDDAREALNEWEKKYRRFLEKRELMNQLNILYRELAWSRYYKVKNEIESVEMRISTLKEDLHDEKISLMKVRNELNFIDQEYLRHVEELMSIVDSLLVIRKTDLRERDKWRESISSHLDNMNILRKRYASAKGIESVTLYKIELLEREIKGLENDLKELEGALKEAYLEASKQGEEIYTSKSHQDIINEIREVKAKLELYTDVDESIEATYNYYRSLYKDLEEKMKKILVDKEKAEGELKKRMLIWQRKIQEYVEEVSSEYNKILSRLNSQGYAKVINIDDIDKAGLELYVGFGGVEPSLMDVYSQSGGERTAAAMAFLLALQQFIKAPFRAVDEFDVHMDPRNREIVMEYLVDMMGNRNEQYIIITPGYITEKLRNANIVVVQKMEGVSIPKKLTKEEEINE